MNYQKINIYSGWIIWLVATLVYVLTLEPTAGFWDTGEFIASAYKLEVGHPPGAPLFMLLARTFALFVPMEYAATSINFLSALCSSFTILFLFWSITHFAKSMADKAGELSKSKLVAVIGSGVVGALAYTFSDSFWFSAVEGEVYAMSSLFTAVVFWAILKWESVAHKQGEMRWVIFIAYMMGLSIGVHLLNLLAIPAIAFVYYFKRYKATPKGIAATGLVALFILGLVQVGIIQGMVNMAGKFELLFVNQLGMPFNTGVILYALLIIGTIAFLLFWTRKKQWPALNTLVLGIMMILIGYSTFAMIVIRSSANPPMDENNPENLFSLLAYLNREQYGDRPLLYGQYFTTPVDSDEPYVDGPKSYVKSYSVKKKERGQESLVESFVWKQEAEDYVTENGPSYFLVGEYVASDVKKKSVPNYDAAYSGFFPRMYSSSGNHIAQYKEWSNYKNWGNDRARAKLITLEANKRESEGKLNAYIQYYNGNSDPSMASKLEKEIRFLQKDVARLNKQLQPSFAENMRFFVSYQLGWMYGRYFMWNYAGKQDDIQGHGQFDHGNWLSGVDMLDAERLGNRAELPESVVTNKGFNKFYLIPLILGLIGLVFQLLRAPKEFTVVTLLFMLTGVAIVVYLNQYPYQPRERDYAYVGSFYAFAIWIGLSVYALYHAAVHMDKKDLGTLAGMAFGGSAVIFVLEMLVGGGNAFSFTLFYMAVVVVALFGIAVLSREIKISKLSQALVLSLLCLSGPYLMAKDGWDDHNRSKRRTAVDFGKNYFDSLAPNAILFTNGDNDTFPLWYLQEVEGYRTDVRIVNMSLLNTDWYIEQMKKQAYDAPPVPIKMPEQKYRQGTRDIVLLSNEKNRSDAFIDVDRAMEIALDDNRLVAAGDGKAYSYLPTSKFSLPVDTAVVMASGMISPEEADMLVSEVTWEIADEQGPKQYILKNSFAVLDLLRNNNWERPVYFAVTTGPEVYMGLQQYFRLEGLAYRLVPIRYPVNPNPNISGGVAADIMFDNMLNKFQWGNMDDTTGSGVYMDENNRRMVTNLRLQFANLAEVLVAEEKHEKAIETLDYCMKVMPEKNVPYDRILLPIIEAYLEVGELDKGKALAQRLFDINEDNLNYYHSLEARFASQMSDDAQMMLSVNNRLEQVITFYAPDDELSKELKQRMEVQMDLFQMGMPSAK